MMIETVFPQHPTPEPPVSSKLLQTADWIGRWGPSFPTSRESPTTVTHHFFLPYGSGSAGSSASLDRAPSQGPVTALNPFHRCRSACGAGARSHQLPAFSNTGVSTFQPVTQRLCLSPCCSQRFRLSKLQGLREDPIDLFLVISDAVQSAVLLLQLMYLVT